MSDLSELGAVAVLLALLPGFLTAELIGALVLREKRTALDRVIQAMIYTFLSHLLWSCVSLAFPQTAGSQLIGLGACALLWGLALTWIINTGAVHGLLHKVRLTRTASRPNEWYDAFYRTQRHIIVHLKDGRRMFGWPLLYPKRSQEGHIFLTGAEWLDRPDDAQSCPRVDFLIDVADVRFIEFVPPKNKETGDD